MLERVIVDDYIWAVARHAIFKAPDAQGLWRATVAGMPSVASGLTVQQCIWDLIPRIEDWVCTSLEHGWTLPVVDGIDLTKVGEQALADYRRFRERTAFRSDSSLI